MSTAPLRWRTRPADGTPSATPAGCDPVVFASPRRQLRGHGVALRIDLPAPWPDHVGRVAEVLAGVAPADGPQGGGRGGDGGARPADGEPGTGPVAIGALPYDRDAPATLVVPRVLHGATAEGRRWTTTVGPAGPGAPGSGSDPGRGGEPAETGAPDGRSDDPGEVTVRAAVDPADWCHTVALATGRIRAGELTKVVLARELVATATRPWDVATVFARLCAAAPAALHFAVDGFVGATPELLVSRVGDVVRAQPMAGTTARTGDPAADQRRAGELLASAKNRAEHQVTIDAVHDGLLPWCSYLDAEPTPSVVAAGPVQHLATLVEGRLSQPAPSVLDLVVALHPTPAVGGWPTAAALDLQRRLEGTARGRYAGPVGWVDGAGNGAFGVGLRGVQLDGPTARWFAGVGVVADSDPLAELEETRAKAQAVLTALVRP